MSLYLCPLTTCEHISWQQPGFPVQSSQFDDLDICTPWAHYLLTIQAGRSGPRTWWPFARFVWQDACKRHTLLHWRQGMFIFGKWEWSSSRGGSCHYLRFSSCSLKWKKIVKPYFSDLVGTIGRERALKLSWMNDLGDEWLFLYESKAWSFLQALISI